MRARAMTLLFGAAVVSSVACAGTVSTPPSGTGDSGTRPGCLPIPKEPVYACLPRARQADDCAPWKGDPASATGYPQRCAVDLPQPDVFSGGCGPQRCYCDMFPSPDGSSKPDWVCPA
jgi:hypothetical protein